jgi:hypothetical protein
VFEYNQRKHLEGVVDSVPAGNRKERSLGISDIQWRSAQIDSARNNKEIGDGEEAMSRVASEPQWASSGSWVPPISVGKTAADVVGCAEEFEPENGKPREISR